MKNKFNAEAAKNLVKTHKESEIDRVLKNIICKEKEGIQHIYYSELEDETLEKLKKIRI